MAVIDDVKLSLRLKSTAYDGEIITIINACKTDLSLAGVDYIFDYDPMVKRAIILYSKANFGADANADRYMRAYESLKNSLALSGDYTEG